MLPPRRHLQVRRTVLVVVEGDTEFAFCRYLKANGSQGRNLQLVINNANGGSPDKIVERAWRLHRQSAYDHVAIVLDDDQPIGPTGQRTVRSLHAQLIRFQPCIEGFFLRLMARAVPGDSAACKRAFHEHGLGERDKLDHEAYHRLFPLSDLETLKRNPQFAELWHLFTNETP